jgi:hypothetical protein
MSTMRVEGLVHPGLELAQRIGCGIGLFQRVALVALAFVGQIGCVRHGAQFRGTP